MTSMCSLSFLRCFQFHASLSRVHVFVRTNLLSFACTMAPPLGQGRKQPPRHFFPLPRGVRLPSENRKTGPTDPGAPKEQPRLTPHRSALGEETEEERDQSQETSNEIPFELRETQPAALEESHHAYGFGSPYEYERPSDASFAAPLFREYELPLKPSFAIPLSRSPKVSPVKGSSDRYPDVPFPSESPEKGSTTPIVNPKEQARDLLRESTLEEPPSPLLSHSGNTTISDPSDELSSERPVTSHSAPHVPKPGHTHKTAPSIVHRPDLPAKYSSRPHHSYLQLHSFPVSLGSSSSYVLRSKKKIRKHKHSQGIPDKRPGIEKST